MALSVTVLLIGKLVTILENEGTAIAGVRDEIQKIKDEFLSMKAFLVDAEANRTTNEGEKLWVARIRDLAYDVEDIMDEFMYKVYEKQSGSQLSRMLHKTIHAPSNLWFKRKIAKKLQKINEMIKAIPELKQRYDVGNVVREAISEDTHKLMQNQAESSFLIMEDELVGIEDKKQILTGWLMDDEQHQTLISVVGMGGSGKTTLVAKTFNTERVKRHFDCCAWITVSQTYVEVDLLRSMIKEFHKSTKENLSANLNDMTAKELKEMLIDYLKSKRYLVVLDDVWKPEVWRDIKVSLQDRQHGSRIIFTTRNEEVASDSSHVHHIQPLKKNEAWELFSRKAFSTYQNKTCPPELQSLACQLVEKCEGLPLAVVCLAGLMSSKKSLDQWEKVQNSFNWHLHNNSSLDPVKNILMLSFKGLTSELKHCFLYCSLFPEDHIIRRKRLMALWIAEGFVEHVKGVRPEEVADGYLWELSFRSMLQVVERNGTGRPKKVKMHDLMRELALSTAEKEKFGHVYNGREAIEDISTRRLAIHKMEAEIKPWLGMSKIRSLLVFDTDINFSPLNTLVSQFKMLRTLDLEDVQIDKLPDVAVYLRYLNLKDSLIQELPESIGRLRNLQFLNIKDSKIESLPQGITKLLNLRHLIMYRYSFPLKDFKLASGTRAPSDICKLRNLQSLLMIESEGDTIRLMGNLTQLRSIGISNVKEINEIDLWVSVKKMALLRSLALLVSNEEEILPVKAQSPPLPHLRKLYLAGRLQSAVIPWFSSLHSLTTLCLHWTRLEEDILPRIESLPNLTELDLTNAYVGEELCFRRGFVKLEELILANFASLKKITIEQGVMPNLVEVHVSNCMALRTVPMGLEYLSHLRTFILWAVPEEIIDPIRKGGADRPKVQHIPEISISHWLIVENLA